MFQQEAQKNQLNQLIHDIKNNEDSAAAAAGIAPNKDDSGSQNQSDSASRFHYLAMQNQQKTAQFRKSSASMEQRSNSILSSDMAQQAVGPFNSKAAVSADKDKAPGNQPLQQNRSQFHLNVPSGQSDLAGSSGSIPQQLKLIQTPSVMQIEKQRAPGADKSSNYEKRGAVDAAEESITL